MITGRLPVGIYCLQEHIAKIAEIFGLENFGTIVIFAYFSQSLHIDVCFCIINMRKCIYLEALQFSNKGLDRDLNQINFSQLS